MRFDITRICCLIGDVGKRDDGGLKGITASFYYVIWETHRGVVVFFYPSTLIPHHSTVLLIAIHH